jgi:hypothetical protein
VLTDPSTLEELEAKYYQSPDGTITITGDRIMDVFSAKSGPEDNQTFTCVVTQMNPRPRDDYYMIAVTTDANEAVRIENQAGSLVATVMVHDPFTSP